MQQSATSEESNPLAAAPIRRLLTVVGARPQFVKAFPLSRAITAHSSFNEIMVHTGQHFDFNMSEVFFSELGIPDPKYRLQIHGGSHAVMTARMLEALEEIMTAESPAAVVVYGDTNSTLAGALAASKLHLPIVHIEAGLRSYNRRTPEEINRVIVDHLSSVLFCPTQKAVENLAREGIADGVFEVGDLMYDAALLAAQISGTNSAILKTLNLIPGKYGIATIHREENTLDQAQLTRLVDYLQREARQRPIVMPLHPRTRAALAAAGLDLEQCRLKLTDPLGYLDMCELVKGSEIIFTDSGGLQREAYFHRVPCITLRSETEWTETVQCGWNRLWEGPDYLPRRPIAEYGDGHAAAGILEILWRELSRTPGLA